MKQIENNKVEHCIFSAEGGAVVILKKGILHCIPITEVAGLRNTEYFKNMNKKELKKCNNVFMDIVKKLNSNLKK